MRERGLHLLHFDLDLPPALLRWFYTQRCSLTCWLVAIAKAIWMVFFIRVTEFCPLCLSKPYGSHFQPIPPHTQRLDLPSPRFLLSHCTTCESEKPYPATLMTTVLGIWSCFPCTEDRFPGKTHSLHRLLWHLGKKGYGLMMNSGRSSWPDLNHFPEASHWGHL